MINATLAPEAPASGGLSNQHLFVKGQKQDICLVQACRSMMLQRGLHHRMHIFDGDQYVLDAEGIPTAGQMFLLSRFWNNQLLKFPTVTQEARYYLTGTESATHWLSVFELKVIPHCLGLELPSLG